MQLRKSSELLDSVRQVAIVIMNPNFILHTTGPIPGGGGSAYALVITLWTTATRSTRTALKDNSEVVTGSEYICVGRYEYIFCTPSV